MTEIEQEVFKHLHDENSELKGMLKEARELILAAIYVNYKQTNAAAELVDKITKKIGR
mgnify:CR=1 FL=1